MKLPRLYPNSFDSTLFPSTISSSTPNVLMDIDPSTGITLDSAGNVFSVADKNLNGMVFSQNALGNNPPLLGNALNGWPVFNTDSSRSLVGNTAAKAILSPLISATNPVITTYTVFATTAGLANQIIYYLSGNNQTGLETFSLGTQPSFNALNDNAYAPRGVSTSGGNHQVVSQSLRCQSPDFHIWTVVNDWSNNIQQQYLDGVLMKTDTPGLTTQFQTGTQFSFLFSNTASPTNAFRGQLARLIIFPGAHTQAQMDLVHNGLSAQYNIPVKTSSTTRLIQMHGDSITEGTALNQNAGIKPLVASLPIKVYQQLNSPTTFVENAGWGGVNCTQLATDRPLTIDVQSITGLTRAIYFFWAGTNDINQGVSAATCYATMKANWQAAQAARPGIKVIVGTPIDRNLSATPLAQLVALRNTINSNAIADGADAICDFGGLSQFLTGAGVYTNGTYYYGDGVHPKSTGNDLLAALAVSTINFIS